MALILILDAGEASAAALARELSARGHRVRRCERAQQALRLNRLLALDLIWVAWPMTGIQDLEFLRRARQKRPQVPVVFACREEPGADLRAQLKARGASLLLRAGVPVPVAAAAAEACLGE